MKRLLAGLLFVCVLGFGQTSTPHTVYQQVYTDVETVPVTSTIVTNVGQSWHFLILHFTDNPPNVCVAAAVNPNVVMQYSFDNILWFGIDAAGLFQRSTVFNDSNGNIVQWTSFANPYPYVRFYTNAFDTANCVMDGYYSGSTTGYTVGHDRIRTIGRDNENNDDLVEGIAVDGRFGKSHVVPFVFDGNAWDRLLDCEDSIPIVVGAATTLELVGLIVSESIRVCSFSMTMAAAGTAQFVYGTGANCVVGTTAITGAYDLGAGFTAQDGDNIGRLFTAAVSNALCLVTTGGGATAAGLLTYAQYE